MLIAHLSDLHLGRRAAGDDLGAQRLQTLREALPEGSSVRVVLEPEVLPSCWRSGLEDQTPLKCNTEGGDQRHAGLHFAPG